MAKLLYRYMYLYFLSYMGKGKIFVEKMILVKVFFCSFQSLPDNGFDVSIEAEDILQVQHQAGLHFALDKILWENTQYIFASPLLTFAISSPPAQFLKAHRRGGITAI